MNYKTGTYRTTTELITALRSFMVTDCSLTERAYGVDGTGYKLLVSDANAQYNFRTALNEKVVDVQDGNLTGLAMNFSTAYDATKAWNLQTNYTRYLHNIPQDGYYLPDGDNDYVQLPSLTFTDYVSFGFEYNYTSHDITNTSGDYIFKNSANDMCGMRIHGYNYPCDSCTSGKAQIWITFKHSTSASGGEFTFVPKTGNLIPIDGQFHKIMVGINLISKGCVLFIDGVEYTGDWWVGGLTFTNPSTTTLRLFYNLKNPLTLKNYFIFSDLATQTQANYFQTGNITAIDNKILWYKCNEADTGAPYTDKALDSSGNGNHGTPTNITGATFFNPEHYSCGLFSTITAGTYYFFESSGEYAIVLKSATNVYQHICFGKVAGTGTNTWIYATGTVSGYLANYSTNNKYMLFSDKVADSGIDYGSLFMYNLTTGIQYSDYDSTNKIEAPIDDVTASTMNKFLSDLWEKGENQFCRIPPLLKLYFFLMSGTDRKYIGYSNLIRLINLKNTDAETEFVLGEDRFKTFPLNSMNDTYFYRGIAVKK